MNSIEGIDSDYKLIDVLKLNYMSKLIKNKSIE